MTAQLDISNVYIHDTLGAGVTVIAAGGAVINQVDVEVENLTVYNANSPSKVMGGISMSAGEDQNNSSHTINARIRNSTFTDDSENYSYGIFAVAQSPSSTGSSDVMNLTLENVTVVGHAIDGMFPASGIVTGAFTGPGSTASITTTTKNVLAANNQVNSAVGNCIAFPFGGGGTESATITSLGNNIADDASCGFTSTGDQENVPDIMSTLGPLQDNGGSVPTMALLTGSPAIDAGATISGLAVDQRGVARPQCAAFDVGAYEYDGECSAVLTNNSGNGASADPTTTLASTGDNLWQYLTGIFAVIATGLGLTLVPKEAVKYKAWIWLSVLVSLISLTSLNAPHARAAVGDISYAFQWGSSGSGNGQFTVPAYVDVGPDGSVYISDSGNDRIQKFTSTGTYLLQWGTEGTANGQFNRPTGIAIDNSGNVYVMDTDNDRVQKFDADGNFLLAWGVAGTGPGEFSQAYGLEIAQDGTVLTTDADNNTVNRYNATTGAYIETIGSVGSGPGQFNGPTDVAVDTDGNIYVIDVSNYRVEVFSATGTYIRNWGSNGSGDGQFTYAFSIVVSPDNIVYVGDYLASRLQAFTREGSFLGKWGSTGTGNGQFNVLGGAAFLNDGSQLYVADVGSSRIQAFLVEVAAEDTPSPTPSTTVSPANTPTNGATPTSPTNLVRVGPLYAAMPLLLAVVATGSYIYLDWRRHLRPLREENPDVHYTLWHHMRVVTVPLFQYRFSVVVSHRSK